MLRRLPGWRTHLLKGGVALRPLDPSLGDATISHWERRRPLRRIMDVARMVAAEPGFSAGLPSAPELFVTDEGEHAAMVVVDGTWRSRPGRRIAGCVWGDDFYSLTVTSTGDEQRFATLTAITRTLVAGSVLGLGIRRRRFVYQPPAGWHGYSVGQTATWLPLEHPRDPRRLVVYPAVPRTGRYRDALASLERAAVRPVRTRRGLAGGCVRAAEPPRSLLVLEDEHYLYRMLLAGGQEADEGLLKDVAEAVEPVPVPSPVARGEHRDLWMID